LTEVRNALQAIEDLTFKDSLPSGLNLLLGASGCGKTIFCEQFAYETLESGGKVLWVTTEELPSRLRESMKRFGWNVEKYEKDGKFTILDAVSPARLGTSEKDGLGMINLDPTGMLIVLSEQLRAAPNGEAQDKIRPKIILIIDSISRLLLSCDYRTVIDFVSCLNSRMEHFGVVGLATLSEGAHDEKALNAVSFSCSGTIRFRIRDSGETRKRDLRLETLRGRNHDDRWKNYSITSNGLDLEL